MNSNIILYEAKTEADIRRFRAELRAYHARDIFPGDKDREELAYFLGKEYRGQIEALRKRERDPLHFLFLRRDGEEIGFAMPVRQVLPAGVLRLPRLPGKRHGPCLR